VENEVYYLQERDDLDEDGAYFTDGESDTDEDENDAKVDTRDDAPGTDEEKPHTLPSVSKAAVSDDEAAPADQESHLEDGESKSRTSRKRRKRYIDAAARYSVPIPYDLHAEGAIFPYILVNIGTGISILRVDSPTRFERISGSAIGGGTYFGLCKLCVDDERGSLTFAQSFAMAQKGHSNGVNMTVADIYGGDYSAFGLKGDVVAANFGKLGRGAHVRVVTRDGKSGAGAGSDVDADVKDGESRGERDRVTMKQSVKRQDVARALLEMISMNAAQLAYLNAVRARVSRIIFAGNYLRQNELAMSAISYAINFWTKGEMKALFLKHEGYFGSMGMFLIPESELS
jgi:type II pantothenate kinase